LVPGETSNRISVAMGFGILAAGQVAHGGSFNNFEVDGAEILIGARALGFAFVLVGIVGGLRAGMAALTIGGWELKESLFLAPAGAAVLVAAAALNGSRGSGPKTMRRLALAALFLSAAELFSAADPNIEFGAGVVSGWAYSAHGLKVLGYLALGAWFWTGVRSSIRTRFVASFAALLIGVVLALASALTGVISANVQDAELDEVFVQGQGAEKEIKQDTRELKKNVAQIAVNLDEELATGEDVTRQLEQARDLFDLDFVMVMNPRGQVVRFDGDGPAVGKRAVETKLTGIDVIEISGSPVINSVLDRFAVAAAPAQVGRDRVAIVAANEINSPGDPSRRLGVVAAGTYIDATTMADIKDRLGHAASLVVQGRTVATSVVGGFPRRGLIPAEARLQVANGQTVSEQVVVEGRSFSASFTPILGGDNRPIATLVLSTPAQTVVQARQGVTSVLFLVAMLVGATALALAWFSGRRITRPIQVLTDTAQAVREGNLQVEAPVSGEDEVGRLGETFNEMTASLFKMTNDLRDAARQEHRLRARIETIIESMADGLVAVDADRKVLAFNREAERLTGIPGDEAIGQPVQNVLTTKDSQGQDVPLPIYDLASGSAENIFVEQRGGKPVPVVAVSAPLTGEEGEAAGGVLVLRDMTREREVERMKTEFLSNISHELRTPLTPIKGYAEILGRKDIAPEKVQKFVAGILESTNRLERIVQLLVDFSAMEAGRLEPRSKTIDISTMVEELATEWSKRSDRHSLVTDIGHQIPDVVGDERLLRRSLEEVLDNAVKFSPYGGTITLEVKRVGTSGNGSDPGGLVEVTISDEGIGIPADDIPRIFSDFQQLDGSETRTFGGLGLGLAFVRRIVQAHDGSVMVESRPEHGTRLTIAIPAAAGGD
ncbi:MAG: cell wall metabolism sensor histidine kinase WalK, partial [Actinomycetota bacterium]|nr:cell wall metabolism sensor histidine kinase WalK [Actinomycetota bacterium]